MAVLITVEAVAIALLAVLVAGLLRSHAEILRALHDAGIDTGHENDRLRIAGRSPVARNRSEGAAAADVVGVTPDGRVDRDRRRRRAVTTRCSRFCPPAASPAPASGARSPSAARTPCRCRRAVIVTKDASEESESKVRDLAPRGVPVVMSSQAWADYGVPGAPYFVYVDGASGRITGEGTAPGWDQLTSLLRQAADDGVLGTSRPARTDAERRGAGRSRVARRGLPARRRRASIPSRAARERLGARRCRRDSRS